MPDSRRWVEFFWKDEMGQVSERLSYNTARIHNVDAPEKFETVSMPIPPHTIVDKSVLSRKGRLLTHSWTMFAGHKPTIKMGEVPFQNGSDKIRD